MMKISKDSIYDARQAGYSDDEIIGYLGQKGYGQQIETARSEGYSLDDIVDNLAGEEHGFMNRIKQGAADFYLSTAQMGNYLGQQTGLGDIQFGTDGINYVSPEELQQQQAILQDAVKLNEMSKGDTGLAADFAVAMGNPMTWLSGMVPGGAAVKGMAGGAGLEVGTPQQGEFDLGEKATDTGIAGTVGAIAGPVIEKAAAPVVGAVAKGAGYIPRKIGGMVAAPFSSKMATPRAKKSLGEMIPDKDTAVEQMGRETIADLTPAQRSGSEDLMALQNKVADESPDVRLQLSEMEEKARGQLGDALDELGGGNVAQTRDFIEGRRAGVTDRLTQGASQAQDEALESATKVTPTKRPSEASTQVRDELEAGLTQMKGRERNLWSQVPDETNVDVTSTRGAIDDLVSKTPTAQRDDVPADLVNKVIDGETQSIGELQGLRSKLLEEGRIARANGNYNKARIHDDLADSVLADMGAQADNIQGEAGDALRNALDFSREVNQKYRQGSVGKVMGSDKVGGDKVAPELTLDKTIGTGKGKGGVALGELEEAAPTEGLKEGVSEYVMNNFKQRAMKDGKVDPKAANKFLDENADMLDRLPDLKSNIESSIKTQATATTKAGKAEGVKKKLFSKQYSKTAEFLDAPVGREFERIMASKNPGGLAAELRRQVAKDKSGEALKGLKTAAIEHVVSKSGMSGKKMLEMVKNKKNDPVFRELFTNKERKRLYQIADELKLLDGTGRMSKRIVNDTPNRILHMLVTTAGARSGAKLGEGTSGASLKTAQAGSKLFGDFFKNLTVDKSEALIMKAVTDDELMKALLTDAAAPMAEKRLRTWLSKNRGFADVLIGGQAGAAAADYEE